MRTRLLEKAISKSMAMQISWRIWRNAELERATGNFSLSFYSNFNIRERQKSIINSNFSLTFKRIFRSNSVDKNEETINWLNDTKGQEAEFGDGPEGTRETPLLSLRFEHFANDAACAKFLEKHGWKNMDGKWFVQHRTGNRINKIKINFHIYIYIYI
jgi:hypothetical protein